MNNSKKRKNTSNSSASFRQIKNGRRKIAEPPHYTYLFTERETTALDTIFAHLFEKITEENRIIDS